jgi:hypothetical protein
MLQIEDDTRCKICLAAPLNCVMLECGHLCACQTCAHQLADCPICRRGVSRVVSLSHEIFSQVSLVRYLPYIGMDQCCGSGTVPGGQKFGKKCKKKCWMLSFEG